MTKELVLAALDRAYYQKRPRKKVQLHSDRGSQYTFHNYQACLRTYKMVGSMRQKGNCYDNACNESFHSVLKNELVYLEKFKTREQAKKRILNITYFYNGKRTHSAIEHFAPK